MGKMRRLIAISIALLVFTISIPSASAYTDLVGPWKLGPYKVFTVNFSHALNEQSLNKDTVYVLNDEEQCISNIEFSISDTQLKIYNTKGYESGTYTLYLTKDIHSKNGTQLKETVTKEFVVDASKHTGESQAMEIRDWINEGISKSDLIEKIL